MLRAQSAGKLLVSCLIVIVCGKKRCTTSTEICTQIKAETTAAELMANATCRPSPVRRGCARQEPDLHPNQQTSPAANSPFRFLGLFCLVRGIFPARFTGASWGFLTLQRVDS